MTTSAGGANTSSSGGSGGAGGRGDGSSKGRGRGGAGGRGQNRGSGGPRRGGKGAGSRGQGDVNTAATAPGGPTDQEAARGAQAAVNKPVAAGAQQSGPEADDDDAEVCFICANPVAHHSIAPCNHKTCHICGLRMRALYKTKDCAHCRTPASFVIFTDDPDKRFEDYTDSDITSTDSSIGIKYTNEDIVGDTVLLLRYNCPDASCDFAGLGWPDLHRHVKSAHRKRMCDLCTRNKKVFTHEHELFADRELEKHMRRGDDKPGAADQTGFKGHPMCGFCGERFYDDDKLFDHCRMKHERCFICDRRDSRQPHYFLNYEELEKHFKKDHFICPDRGCMDKKFVVFESEMDLQAHHLAEHAGKGAGRDARLVDMSAFDLRQSYQPERRDGGGDGRSRGGRGGRGNRGRDPNEDSILPTTTTTTALPLRRDELAFQRQMAINSAPAGSNRTFRGQLSAPTTSTLLSPSPAQTSSSRTAPAPAPATTAANPSQTLNVADTANLSPDERARLVRHGSVIERAANLLGNDAQKISTFRSHVSSYRQGAFTAPQLMEALFTLFADVSSNALGILVRELADLFEDKAKADGLRKAWQDWRAINEDYPSLPGPNGAAAGAGAGSSSGWAQAAGAAASPGLLPVAAPSQRTSTRVLKLKNSTRLAGPAPNASTVPPGWVAVTKTSKSSKSSSGGGGSRPPPSSAFPSLPPAPSSSSSSTSAAAAAAAAAASSSSRPTWIASSSASSSSRTPGRGPLPPNTRAEDAFPALPVAPKPLTTIFGYGKGRGVRRDFGQRESNFQWGASSATTAGGGGGGAGSTSSTPAAAAAGEEGEEQADQGDEAGGGGAGKGKKAGKKGKKQILVQWG